MKIDFSLNIEELTKEFIRHSINREVENPRFVGIYDPNTDTIFVANDLEPDRKYSILVHELIEMLDFKYNLSLKPHDKIRSLEHGLHHMLISLGITMDDLVDNLSKVW